jgi:branched-subunit amino acid aminotransferase/4-amino-4-deoxychorismate lyase
MSQTGFLAINGRVTPLEEAAISPLDRGFLFGDQIVETMLGDDKGPWDIDLHLKRLFFSAASIGMTLPWTHEALAHEITTLVQKAAFPRTYIRLVMTRGEGLALFSFTNAPNKMIYVLPVATPSAQHPTQQQGLALKSVLNPSTARGPRPKVPNYLPAIVAVQQAQAEGFDDILWVNEEQQIAESSIANIIFFGRYGSQHYAATPDADVGILLGVTRGKLLQNLAAKGLEVEVGPIFLDELARFDGAVLTSSVRGVVSVKCIDDHRFSQKGMDSLEKWLPADKIRTPSKP